jgi:hypothetical protein
MVSEELLMACSIKNCPCTAPLKVGTPEYALSRAHPDAGDLDALRLMTTWLHEQNPFVHLRYADGEINAIVRSRTGLNANGEPYDDPGFCHELDLSLNLVAHLRERKRNFLIGGDWSNPGHRDFLLKNNYLENIPWCPSQVFVNGIMTGDSKLFLEALFGRYTHLVANKDVCKRIDGSFAGTIVKVSSNSAWRERDRVVTTIEREMNSELDVVVLCAGMASETIGVKLAARHPHLTVIDMGCFFDPAANLESRSWINERDKRVHAFRKEILPMLKQRS